MPSSPAATVDTRCSGIKGPFVFIVPVHLPGGDSSLSGGLVLVLIVFGELSTIGARVD